MHVEIKSKERESGIELLKILAMVFIVIAHVTQTVGSPHEELPYFNQCFIDLTKCTTNLQYLILVLLRNLGVLGNTIFIISSAWFLCDNNDFKVKKIFHMISDVWIISVFILILLLALKVNVSTRAIIYSIFPNSFCNNWFITCYLLLYAVHPFLNCIIKIINKKTLLIANMLAILLYMIICTLIKSLFYVSPLIIFVVEYFLTAYVKKYLFEFSNNIKTNLFALFIGMLGIISLTIFTDLLGLKFVFFNNKLMHWYSDQNIFLILISFALFNLFRQLKFVNNYVNKVAGLSLLVYIIHENILIRTYVRPQIFVWIYYVFSYHYIILWVFVFAAILFAISLLLSMLYKSKFQIITWKIADKICACASGAFSTILDYMLKLT